MDTPKNDYVDTKTVEKTTDLLKHLAIASGLLAVFKIISRPDILIGAGQPADYVLSAAPIFLFVAYQSKTSKHKGQFIRWTDDAVEYKSKARHGTLVISDLKYIDINLDTIDLHLKDGMTHIINLDDYKEYSDRQRIKSNFEKLQQRLTTA